MFGFVCALPHAARSQMAAAATACTARSPVKSIDRVVLTLSSMNRVPRAPVGLLLWEAFRLANHITRSFALLLLFQSSGRIPLRRGRLKACNAPPTILSIPVGLRFCLQGNIAAGAHRSDTDRPSIRCWLERATTGLIGQLRLAPKVSNWQ